MKKEILEDGEEFQVVLRRIGNVLENVCHN